MQRIQLRLLVSLALLCLAALPASADWDDTGWIIVSANSSSYANGQGSANWYTSPPTAVASANNHYTDEGYVHVTFVRQWTPYGGASDRTFTETSTIQCNTYGGRTYANVKGIKTNSYGTSWGGFTQTLTGTKTTGAQWLETVELTCSTQYYGLSYATVDSN